jgi:hypothetical protein
MGEPERASEFAPYDPTDGRKLLEWESRYGAEARHQIRIEAWYLGILLAAIPTALLLIWLDAPKAWLSISDQKYPAIATFASAWLGGTLGGTLHDLKWLYHTVARGSWNLDRRLWRIFTPHISGGLSFAVVALVSSRLISVFDARALHSLSAVVGTGFLVGYFSDPAIAKLYEIAETLFGSNRLRDRAVPKIAQSTKSPEDEK